MNPNQHRSESLPEPSRIPVQGWHCGHYYYRWNRGALASIPPQALQSAKAAFVEALTPMGEANGGGFGTARFQTSIVSGHKADFCTVMMDPDPLKIDSVHQRLMASPFGVALEPTYSFVSMSEASEYLPNREQYAERLRKSGEDPESATFQAKVGSYEKRLPMMLQQRLAPEFPDWPAICFYPMNKSRNVGANWFLLPFSERSELMSEHAQSGMAFAGRVTQLVTSSVGIDDWEWGVTLWARNPQFLKEIVYTMRYDRASARYGQFGPFYVSYTANADAILTHCRI